MLHGCIAKIERICLITIDSEPIPIFEVVLFLRLLSPFLEKWLLGVEVIKDVYSN